MADTDLLQELLETFRLEAEDLLSSISSLLISLEEQPAGGERQGLVENLFRRIHTLKGAAHAVNLLDVAEICQSLETIFSDLKRGEIALSRDLFDRLHAEVNVISGVVFGSPPSVFPPLASCAPAEEAPEPAPHAATFVELPEGKAPASPPLGAGAQQEKVTGQERARVPAQLLEALLLQGEELISAKLMSSHLSQELVAAGRELSELRAERARAIDLAHKVLRSGAGGEAVQLATLLKERCEKESELEHRLLHLGTRSEKGVWALSTMVDTLLEEMRKLHLLPFATLFNTLPKMVRDLASELGKETEFSCRGGELEVDRRILAELREPFLHLVRNVLDHGVESPADRVRRGKPSAGRITVTVRHLDGNRAEILVTDDGQGIDLVKVKAAAVAQEILSPEEAAVLGDPEAQQLIFESGISTSAMITTLSGRGLGLAIVREALEKLGGHVSVHSRRGEGSTFRLVLPLSFAMIRALLVETCGRSCLLPAAHVECSARVKKSEVKTVENRETVCLEGEVLSLARLGQVLELTERLDDDNEQLPVVVLGIGEKRIAFAVDRVVGMQEVLAKPLGPQLKRVRNVAGASVLGDGSVVPLLNASDLFRSALSAPRGVGRGAPPAGRGKQVSVLVAEDSITSRTLLKNILEASGYRVKTAIDGSDALGLLKVEDFDVVVSDVEMPRMDGFELTAAIRSDKRLSELPVILVTGLESREDRERGIDVGANAYIVKSSFDQSRLIEAIGKLA